MWIPNEFIISPTQRIQPGRSPRSPSGLQCRSLSVCLCLPLSPHTQTHTHRVERERRNGPETEGHCTLTLWIHTRCQMLLKAFGAVCACVSVFSCHYPNKCLFSLLCPWTVLPSAFFLLKIQYGSTSWRFSNQFHPNYLKLGPTLSVPISYLFFKASIFYRCKLMQAGVSSIQSNQSIWVLLKGS